MIKLIGNILSSAILGGISISIACITYLKLGGIVGAILFAFGLLIVVHYGWCLYTGQAGFVKNRYDFIVLPFILIGNIIGCILMALIMRYSQPGLIESAQEVVSIRMTLGTVQCLLMGVGCGFIMTAAVKFGRDKFFLPLLFGVPVFIVCGFLHSIADAFYIAMLPIDILNNQYEDILMVYLMVVLGNFIGCNLVRIISLNKNI